jgi:alpha-L-rhamnosidase
MGHLQYTIKATSFCGIYVDGDRERIPYEADAYINQLCHYCVDNDYLMARKSHEYLIRHCYLGQPNGFLHSILMAWADYMFTGNSTSLHSYYEDLKAKALLSLKRNDGLISTMTGLVSKELLASVYLLDKNNPNLTATLKDIVDWPPGSFATNGTGERDDFEMKEFNNVVNAFHYYGLVLLSKIASVLQQKEDAILYSKLSEIVKKSFNDIFFDSKTGLYKDGEGSSHVSLHGNMFPLVFGLVTEENKKTVSEYLQTRGMVCSVYGAQIS